MSRSITLISVMGKQMVTQSLVREPRVHSVLPNSPNSGFVFLDLQCNQTTSPPVASGSHVIGQGNHPFR